MKKHSVEELVQGRVPISASSVVYLQDCMAGMKGYPDGYFDLAVVDPPYGMQNSFNASGRLKKYGNVAQCNNQTIPWDEYFKELFRVSRFQIIWGYNHFSDQLPSTTEFIFWYKHQPVNSYSDGELAWTSGGKTAKCFDYPYFGSHGRDTERIHPTQKPVALYDWIYKNYAEKRARVLDTHLGSQSSRIAANKAGINFVGFEIDEDYYNEGNKRFERFVSQLTMF